MKTTDDHKGVFGIYDSRMTVELTVDRLKGNGFQSTDISVLMPQEHDSEKLTREKITKAPEAVTTGASTGFIIGGTLGWLAGIGAIVIPGIGPLIAAGPILALLAGAGTGAALGGLTGGLIGLGIPEFEAKQYENHLKDGGILLSVHTDNSEWIEKAKKILKETGARDISTVGETPEEPVRRKSVEPGTKSMY